MYALLIYSLKVGVCLAVFYLFFKLCLARETLHRLNRVLILVAVALSFVLPVAVVTVYREVPAVVPDGMVSPAFVVTDAPAVGAWDWRPWVGGVFLLGAAVMLAHTVRALAGVAAVIRRGRRTVLDDGAVLVVLPHATTPFSWGRYIVISEEDLARCGGIILTHERAHRRLHHTADLLFMDLAGALQWFNPAMWLLKRDLRELHEYEADAAVLRSGVNAREYQLLLIKKAVGGRWYSVANCFNHSKLKNRITMMLQKKSSKWAGARALLLLPLVGCAVGAFAETVEVPVRDKGTQNLSISAENCRLTLVIIDGKNLPVAGAAVTCGKNKGVTDKKGKVRLKVPQGGTVTVEYAGCEPMVVQVPRQDKATMEVPILGGESLSGAGGSSDRDGNVSSGSIKPLIVIDGREADKDFRLLDIDSSRIASVSVLKGKAATDKYGDKARGGAVEVTLKKEGQENGAVVMSSGGSKIQVFSAGKQSDEDRGLIHIKDNDKSSDKPLKKLIVIDGKVVDKDFRLLDIDSSRIASVSVLKGKAATDKYGDKARDGVVEVTLKKENGRK